MMSSQLIFKVLLFYIFIQCVSSGLREKDYLTASKYIHPNSTYRISVVLYTDDDLEVIKLGIQNTEPANSPAFYENTKKVVVPPHTSVDVDFQIGELSPNYNYFVFVRGIGGYREIRQEIYYRESQHKIVIEKFTPVALHLKAAHFFVSIQNEYGTPRPVDFKDLHVLVINKKRKIVEKSVDISEKKCGQGFLITIVMGDDVAIGEYAFTVAYDGKVQSEKFILTYFKKSEMESMNVELSAALQPIPNDAKKFELSIDIRSSSMTGEIVNAAGILRINKWSQNVTFAGETRVRVDWDEVTSSREDDTSIGIELFVVDQDNGKVGAASLYKTKSTLMKYQINEKSTPNRFTPGIRYFAKFHIESEEPIVGEPGWLTYQFDNNSSDSKTYKKQIIIDRSDPEDITVAISIPPKTEKIFYTLQFKEQSVSKVVTKNEPYDENYHLQARIVKAIDGMVEIEVRSAESMDFLSYVILKNDNVMKSETVSANFNKAFSFKIRIEDDMTPKSTIKITYYSSQHDQLFSNSIEFEHEDLVDIQYSSPRKRGDVFVAEESLHLNCFQGKSFCGVLAVLDKNLKYVHESWSNTPLLTELENGDGVLMIKTMDIENGNCYDIPKIDLPNIHKSIEISTLISNDVIFGKSKKKSFRVINPYSLVAKGPERIYMGERFEAKIVSSNNLNNLAKIFLQSDRTSPPIHETFQLLKHSTISAVITINSYNFGPNSIPIYGKMIDTEYYESTLRTTAIQFEVTPPPIASYIYKVIHRNAGDWLKFDAISPNVTMPESIDVHFDSNINKFLIEVLQSERLYWNMHYVEQNLMNSTINMYRSVMCVWNGDNCSMFRHYINDLMGLIDDSENYLGKNYFWRTTYVLRLLRLGEKFHPNYDKRRVTNNIRQIASLYNSSDFTYKDKSWYRNIFLMTSEQKTVETALVLMTFVASEDDISEHYDFIHEKKNYLINQLPLSDDPIAIVLSVHVLGMIIENLKELEPILEKLWSIAKSDGKVMWWEAVPKPDSTKQEIENVNLEITSYAHLTAIKLNVEKSQMIRNWLLSRFSNDVPNIYVESILAVANDNIIGKGQTITLDTTNIDTQHSISSISGQTGFYRVTAGRAEPTLNGDVSVTVNVSVSTLDVCIINSSSPNKSYLVEVYLPTGLHMVLNRQNFKKVFGTGSFDRSLKLSFEGTGEICKQIDLVERYKIMNHLATLPVIVYDPEYMGNYHISYYDVNLKA